MNDISGVFVMASSDTIANRGRLTICDFVKLFTEEEGIPFALSQGLLKGHDVCPHCRSPDRVALHKNSGNPDAFDLHCAQCRKRFSVRNGTFFSRSRLPIPDILTIILLFVSDMNIIQTRVSTAISDSSIIEWYSFFREVCAHALNNDNMVIGGPGVKVEISETLTLKRSGNRDNLDQKDWFFVGYCVDQKRGFLFPISDRDPATLMPLINKHIAHGSIVQSDQWLAYQHLTCMSWTQRDVNRSANTGINSFWKLIMRKINSTEESEGDQRHDRVIEAVYKRAFGFNSQMRFHKRLSIFLDHIIDFYSASQAK